MTGAKKWRLERLTITPESAPEYENNTLLFIDWHDYSGLCTYITVENCYLYSVEDTSSWTAEDWDTLSCTAITSQGKHVIIRNNYCKNVNFGISSSGDSSIVEYNIIENFAGDGIRGLGDYNIFQYNTVKNCYDVNANHDDGFQSWSVGEDTVRGIVLRGNTIIEYEDPNQPYKGTLQGIGCFDGFYSNWIVENNVVFVNHYHGICLSGALNCRIINNTVIDRDTTTEISPWIRVGNHKDGSPSEDCIIRNNIYYRTLSTDSEQTIDHNLQIVHYDSNFIDCGHFDFRLKEGSPAIDGGSSIQAPSIDIRGVSRPQGELYDVGAYEYIYEEAERNKYYFTSLNIFPNPFVTFTTISFTLNSYSDVVLEIFNMTGAKVKEIINSKLIPGMYSFRFERENFGSGVYFVVLKVNRQKAREKAILIK